MLSRTPTSAESDQHTDVLRDESQTGGSPTCRGLHRRDASQYRYSQPRMVHSRGVVCAHTGHLKMAQCGASYLAHTLTARAPTACPLRRCTCATHVRQHEALCRASSRRGTARRVRALSAWGCRQGACLEAWRVPAPDGGVEVAGLLQELLAHAEHLGCVGHLGRALHQRAQRAVPRGRHRLPHRHRGAPVLAEHQVEVRRVRRVWPPLRPLIGVVPVDLRKTNQTSHQRLLKQFLFVLCLLYAAEQMRPDVISQ